MYGYVQLKNAGVISSYKRVKIVTGTWEAEQVTPQSIRRTLTGGADKTFTKSFMIWRFISKIYWTPATNYISLSDLKNMMGSAAPADQALSFIDLDGNTFSVVATNNFKAQLMTPLTDGGDSYYFVPLELQQVS